MSVDRVFQPTETTTGLPLIDNAIVGNFRVELPVYGGKSVRLVMVPQALVGVYTLQVEEKLNTFNLTGLPGGGTVPILGTTDRVDPPDIAVIGAPVVVAWERTTAAHGPVEPFFGTGPVSPFTYSLIFAAGTSVDFLLFEAHYI